MRCACRPWLFLVVGAASFVGVGFYLLVDELTRGKPNYTRVESGLWLGGYVDEPPPGVQAVLNLCELEDPYQAETHHWEPIRDAEPAPGLDWLRKQVEFIESQRSEGRSVFVHCRNGVSRSGMVVTAYLMRREGWSRDEALKHLRLHRPEVRPNPAFLLLLLEWEQSLRGRK